MKKELKATKPAKKSSSATKKKSVGRGGARPGAGRKKYFEATQQISIDAPTEILEAMEVAGIENKTAYILSLMAADLQNYLQKRSELFPKLKKIEEVLKEKF